MSLVYWEFFFFFSIFIALYLGLVVGEKHVYKENGLSTRPLQYWEFFD